MEASPEAIDEVEDEEECVEVQHANMPRETGSRAVCGSASHGLQSLRETKRKKMRVMQQNHRIWTSHLDAA